MQRGRRLGLHGDKDAIGPFNSWLLRALNSQRSRENSFPPWIVDFRTSSSSQVEVSGGDDQWSPPDGHDVEYIDTLYNVIEETLFFFSQI